ncbi:uncharacterized protein Z518_10739 [Rhinocladiella mackenziei CBS 650.93]|uniref:F-box domain-containing protein n=1 Tax=Rhinocladiella mackenziei CBS 650.93 TaxID=1442369 RepID=A0A0D2FCI0_9EURO|nr:uncharacterized protein Z518_10739 [Rhinocladiella mackenziei CBS 650.93]KIW99811.1 hypothetical protein Z518_10739 [Rhinocladiella mackenziei CBS 650.93]
MPASWRDGLVNAFPIPQGRVKLKKGSKANNNIDTICDALGEALDETFSAPLRDPFPFFELPAEIRNRIYRLVLFSPTGSQGADGKPKPRTAILTTSKRMHQEVSYILYSSSSFRIFPLQDFESAPVVQDLPLRYRSMVTKLEMVVGSDWTRPPKTWRVSRLLAKRLGKLSAVRTLKIFVTLDPSQPIFEPYWVSFDFYTDFCGNLLRDVLSSMPHLMAIEMDGYSSVDTTGPLVSRLRAEAEAQGKTCTLGPTKLLATPTGLNPFFCQ